MIKVLERSAGNVIGFEVQGEISIKQFREIEPALDKLFAEYDQVNMVVVMKEFSGYGLKEMAGDIKFALKHWSDIGRIAVVGEKKWEELATRVDNFFAKWEEKYFHMDEMAQAWDWAEGK